MADKSIYDYDNIVDENTGADYRDPNNYIEVACIDGYERKQTVGSFSENIPGNMKFEEVEWIAQGTDYIGSLAYKLSFLHGKISIFDTQVHQNARVTTLSLAVKPEDFNKYYYLHVDLAFYGNRVDESESRWYEIKILHYDVNDVVLGETIFTQQPMIENVVMYSKVNILSGWYKVVDMTHLTNKTSDVRLIKQ